MPVITLTSDMGLADHYVGTVKGAILALSPQVNIVDISHDVRPFDLNHAAYLLKSSWQNFPMGTVHIIGVRPELTINTPHVVVHYMSHYFVGADNGIFSLIFDQEPEDIFELNIKQHTDWTFPMKSVFALAAAHLAKGGPPEVLGRRVENIKRLKGQQLMLEPNRIRGSVVHFDRFQNIHTNIPQGVFEAYRANRPFSITLRSVPRGISRIHADFGEVPSGEKVAIWGSNGYLLIGINNGAAGHGGGAQSLLGAKINDSVIVDFHGNSDS
ncbi:MAG: SAM hydrolase/SAM-dependent halogenase family protein [Flavobacteriales bacterium]